ncbi:ABC transporter ATP-binding protein [Virgibacillus sp. 179-BFC.A HS]|uniref:ABC transporter ATP-binding protein n=1 Tax=Tigheibacillus jepli TaxID=3035914 RepID=A0ABU5CL32_9BACI|nr:ABC transporter ATP-binding protein [Virgibacillus sp. 179-BFC.A HS]MDY0407068.1 ABC transporter ATP-binding protein [Virgibacillus sp. 179-BFC.A HS]
MENIISFRHVSLIKNQNKLLSDINWQVNPGEKWAILGLNGSGKTSLLNVVNGYHYPTSGEVSVLGKQFGKTNLPELRKQIGFVSSSLDKFAHVLNRELAEAVILSGKFASFGVYEDVSEADWEEVENLMERLRLGYLQGKPFRLLSQGEQRRVLIARALIQQPSILILDEPCTGLDVYSREEVLDFVENISDDCHIIYVTHHIEELVNQISHVLLLKDGKVFASGKKEDMIQEALLSDAFRVSCHVRWEAGRPWLSLESSPFVLNPSRIN